MLQPANRNFRRGCFVASLRVLNTNSRRIVQTVALVLFSAVLLGGCESPPGSNARESPSVERAADSAGSPGSSATSGLLVYSERPRFTLPQVIAESQGGLIVRIISIEHDPDAPRIWLPASHEHDLVTAKIEKVLFGNFQAGDEIQILQPRELKRECPPDRLPCFSSHTNLG